VLNQNRKKVQLQKTAVDRKLRSDRQRYHPCQAYSQLLTSTYDLIFNPRRAMVITDIDTHANNQCEGQEVQKLQSGNKRTNRRTRLNLLRSS